MTQFSLVHELAVKCRGGLGRSLCQGRRGHLQGAACNRWAKAGKADFIHVRTHPGEILTRGQLNSTGPGGSIITKTIPAWLFVKEV